MLPRLLLLVFTLGIGWQVGAATIVGKVQDTDNNTLPGATVTIQGTTLGTATDADGSYQIKEVPVGTYTLEATYLGYATVTKEVTISTSGTVVADFQLAEDATRLGEVIVQGKSESTERSQNPIQIASIDVTKLRSESADVVSVLDRTAGVRVRQSGGLGSDVSIQLNGLMGRAVRTYVDGIPLNVFSGSIDINNMSVNTIERIDVYKGVMPVDVGTDALAGGVNIVTRKSTYDHLDVSYQIGSFNTHIGTFTGMKAFGEHWFVSANGVYNFSDNNYDIRATQRTPDFQEIEVEVERFHSAHQSSMVNGSIGLRNTTWADQLVYSASYSQRADEIQHGNRIGNRAAGEAEIQSNSLIQNIRYQKAFWDKRLQFDYFGSYIIADESVRDSTTNVYDWFGDIVGFDSQGKEVLSRPSLREGTTTSQIHRLNLGYTFNPKQKIKLSSFLSDQEVVGSDPLAIRIGDVDPNTIPSFLTRSITGLSYDAKWFNEKLETILFGKYYYYDQSTADFRPSSATQVFEYAANGSEHGYGLGLKYTIKEDLFVRTSYERAIRIPDRTEVFGNFITIEPNFFLDPEESQNLNIGGYYKHRFSTDQYISLDANWFLRDQSNLIRLMAGRNENDPAQFVNEEAAEATGIEMTLTTAPIRNLELSASFTHQDILKAGEANATNTNGVGTPIPNIPATFYDISVRYKFKSPFAEADEISLFSYYTFVEEFDLIFQTTRNEQNIIPTQRQVDLGLTYKLENSGLNFSFQVDNLLDAEVYDNYRIPRPGRNFSFKIRYLIRRT